jgi:hypothetical protein
MGHLVHQLRERGNRAAADFGTEAGRFGVTFGGCFFPSPGEDDLRVRAGAGQAFGPEPAQLFLHTCRQALRLFPRGGQGLLRLLPRGLEQPLGRCPLGARRGDLRGPTLHHFDQGYQGRPQDQQGDHADHYNRPDRDQIDLGQRIK